MSRKQRNQRVRAAPQAPTMSDVTNARLGRAEQAGGVGPYTPPARFPADPEEWLAYLKAGQFTAEQQAYLRSNAYGIYTSAINSARGNEALAKEVALGDQIIAVWTAWRAAHPAPAVDPFQGIAG